MIRALALSVMALGATSRAHGATGAWRDSSQRSAQQGAPVAASDDPTDPFVRLWPDRVPFNGIIEWRPSPGVRVLAAAGSEHNADNATLFIVVDDQGRPGGSGSFGMAYPASLFAVDVNGDGREDLVVVGESFMGESPGHRPSVQVFSWDARTTRPVEIPGTGQRLLRAGVRDLAGIERTLHVHGGRAGLDVPIVYFRADCSIRTLESFHLRAADTLASTGPELPSGTNITLLEVGGRIRGATRSYRVRTPSGEGFMFIPPAEIRAACPTD